MVLMEVDKNWVAECMPTSEVFTVAARSEPGEAFVDVVWEGRAARMFAVDLQQRGLPVAGSAACGFLNNPLSRPTKD